MKIKKAYVLNGHGIPIAIRYTNLEQGTEVKYSTSTKVRYHGTWGKITYDLDSYDLSSNWLLDYEFANPLLYIRYYNDNLDKFVTTKKTQLLV